MLAEVVLERYSKTLLGASLALVLLWVFAAVELHQLFPERSAMAELWFRLLLLAVRLDMQLLLQELLWKQLARLVLVALLELAEILFVDLALQLSFALFLLRISMAYILVADLPAAT